MLLGVYKIVPGLMIMTLFQGHRCVRNKLLIVFLKFLFSVVKTLCVVTIYSEKITHNMLCVTGGYFQCPWPYFKVTAMSNAFNWKFYVLIQLSLCRTVQYISWIIFNFLVLHLNVSHLSICSSSFFLCFFVCFATVFSLAVWSFCAYTKNACQ